MIYGLKFLVKYLLINLKFLGSVIKQKPTPQLKVFNISFSLIPDLYSHLKIFNIFKLLRFISAHNFLELLSVYYLSTLHL